MTGGKGAHVTGRFIRQLRMKHALRINNPSPLEFFLRPQFLGLKDLTSTGMPCAKQFFALCHTRIVRTWTWYFAAISVVLFRCNVPLVLN